MNVIDRPPVDARHSRDPDDVDQLLRTFFQEEVPDPWPALEPPPPARPGQKPWSLFRSRFALAASVALLLAGGLVLSGKAPSDAPVRPAGNTLPHADRNPFHPARPPKPHMIEDASKGGPVHRPPVPVQH
ncbi:MAG TPA: hypothetical protein VG013_01695 [Gemmataceae bacterium]|jgi:anti-sigma factor RsiW|nr:hypothetical protein [Gemmataceae bacterium]